MKCEEVTGLIPEFLAGTLTRGEMLRIQAHTVSCAPCNQELESLSSTWKNLEHWPEEEPPEQLHKGFYQMLEGYQQGLKSSQVLPSLLDRLSRLLTHPRLAMPALAALILVAGLFLGRSMDHQEAPEVARLRTDLSQMTQLVSLSLMENTSSSERLTGVSWSARLEHPDERVIDTLLTIVGEDPSVNVRLSAVEALYESRHMPRVRAGLVRALARQESPLLQIALIDSLVAMDEKGVAAQLQELMDNRGINPVVKQRAQQGLMEIR